MTKRGRPPKDPNKVPGEIDASLKEIKSAIWFVDLALDHHRNGVGKLEAASRAGATAKTYYRRRTPLMKMYFDIAWANEKDARELREHLTWLYDSEYAALTHPKLDNDPESNPQAVNKEWLRKHAGTEERITWAVKASNSPEEAAGRCWHFFPEMSDEERISLVMPSWNKLKSRT